MGLFCIFSSGVAKLKIQHLLSEILDLGSVGPLFSHEILKFIEALLCCSQGHFADLAGKGGVSMEA